MTLETFAHAIVTFVHNNEVYALPIVFALAFGESLAFVSLLVPATVILLGIGALVGASDIHFVPIWLAASIGAALGDWVSYWFGFTYKEAVTRFWPLSKHPELLLRGERFVERYGVFSVFAGRFFGPLRASVPLAAGVLAMRFWPFQFANFTSAFVWAGLLLAPGVVGMKLWH